MAAEIRRMASESGRSVDDVQEFATERAAIREYLSGMPRPLAQQLALVETAEWLKVKP